MRVEDQNETMAFLADPATHGCAGPVETVSTHISAIFLCGDRAWKLKQAVRLPYADFSDAPGRLAACEKELALNRATTPELYLRVRRITRQEGGGLEFDGTGPLVDAVVEMRRFEDDALLDRVAERGALTWPMLRDLADEIAAVHARAEVREGAGGAANIAAVLDVNRAGFAESGVFPEAEVAAIDGAFRQALERHAPLLDARAGSGHVRRCHGDLHLRNLVLLDGRPRLFDCLDFNDDLATIDVLYDLAFLVMDLWHRGLHDLSNRLVNRYFDIAGDDDAYALMPFFCALRAAVRAHVIATQSAGAAAGDRDGLRATARGYRDAAMEMLKARPARLVAIGGLSGSGKSTMATAIAPALGAPPGARVLESDRIRKRMHGVPPETRLPETAYAPAVSAAVYDSMARLAGVLLSHGCTVVADAVFDRAERRAALAGAAAGTGARFDGLWLDAPGEVLAGRVAAPRDGVSDATPEVLAAQLSRATAVRDWRIISTAGTTDETLRAIRSALGLPEGDGGRADQD